MAEMQIELALLGNGSIKVNGHPVLIRMARLPMPWQVFCLLSTRVDRWMRMDALAAELWPDAPKESTRNSLKNAVLRLRAELNQCSETLGHPAEWIEYLNDGYRINPLVDIRADYLVCQQLCLDMRTARNRLLGERLSLGRQLLQRYTGSFFHNPKYQDWTKQFAWHLDTFYSENICECMEELLAREMHQEALDMYEGVQQNHQPCDEMMVYRYRALQSLGKRSRICQEYPATKASFSRRGELDGPAFAEIRDIALLAGVKG